MRAVVTGASSGIGRALSLLICRRGGKVLGVARRKHLLDEVKEAAKGGFDYVIADLSKLESIEAVVEGARRFLGRVDLLVNNAGFGFNKRAVDHTMEETAAMAMVNFVAPLALTRALLPLMHRGSTVVNVVTAGIHVLLRKLPVYGATKIALHYVTEALRRELGELGIRVVAVYPGAVATEFHERAGGPPPRGPVASPEEVAEAILAAVEKGKSKVYVPSYLAALRLLGPHLLSVE